MSDGSLRSKSSQACLAQSGCVDGHTGWDCGCVGDVLSSSGSTQTGRHRLRWVDGMQANHLLGGVVCVQTGAEH
jgi:hypothetical protein